MAITTSVPEERYQEYRAGYKHVPETATFELARDPGYYDSHYPDPEIVTHDFYCPHHPDGYEYYYRKDQLPEGYRNEITPECVDYHECVHAGNCFHDSYHYRERLFTAWLHEHGHEPVLERTWTNLSDPSHTETFYLCPLCPVGDQPRFTYCQHGRAVADVVNDYKWQMQHIPQTRTSECTNDCHWGNWRHCHAHGPRYIMTEYAGCVLDRYEHNGHDDSDFYAVIWDEVKKCLRTFEYGSTRYAGGSGCGIDATPEVTEQAYRYACFALAERICQESLRDSIKIVPGKRVRVTKAVKRAKDERNNVPFDMEGTALHVYDSAYGKRVQFMDDFLNQAAPADQWLHRHTISIDNLEVINPGQYIDDLSDCWERAVQLANQVRRDGRWAMVHYAPTPGTICAL